MCFLPAWTLTCPGLVLSSAGLSFGLFSRPGKGNYSHLDYSLSQEGAGGGKSGIICPRIHIQHPLAEVRPAWIQGFVPGWEPQGLAASQRLNFFVLSGISWQFWDKWTQTKPSCGKVLERPEGIHLCGMSWWPHPLGNLLPWELRESPVSSHPKELTRRAIKSRESHLPRNP